MNILNQYAVGIVLGAAALLVFLSALLLICRRSLSQARRSAHLDAVTGSYNAEGFYAAASPLLAASHPEYAVVTAEIVNFLQIQQTFGETDRVLVHVCRTLKTVLAASEPIGRVSASRFCFLIRNREEAAIMARLNRVRESINSFNDARSLPFAIVIHFGIYLPSGNSETPQDVQHKSESVLDEARERSPYRFFRADDNDTFAAKWELVEQMEQSLKDDDFIVFLQPKVRIGDTRIVGAEALIRWRHPRRGMLVPEMFIPPLEEYHMMPRVDRYLFEVVCKKQAEWMREGKDPCPISVNFSLESLLSDDFAQSYADLCRTLGSKPELIEFELHEKLLYEDPKTIRSVIDSIHRAGFQCSLDHFGKTSIPLHMLRELEVDAVKLDSSLFSVQNNSRRNRFVIEAILKLASQMNICTVAEGIDNASQVQYLQQAACNIIQGFYYFKPMSLDEFKRSAYSNGELRYVEKETSPSQPFSPSLLPAQNRNVVMFSYLTGEDRIVFSSCFSPLLEGQTEIANAAVLFAHTPLIHENDRNDFYRLLDRCRKESGWVENTLRFLTSDGRYEWLEVHLHKASVSSTGDAVIQGTLVNAAGWNNEVNRWKEKANRDPLTGVYNREYFEQFASNTLQKEMPASAAIIFVDVDDFKKVNDTLGHASGDDVLCFFAKRLLGIFRHTDIIARYGGDEFVVFANGIARPELEKRLTQLCEVLRYPYRNGTVEYRISASIGAALYPEDAREYKDLLEHADCAVYTAKEQGKDRFVLYQPGMNTAISHDE